MEVFVEKNPDEKIEAKVSHCVSFPKVAITRRFAHCFVTRDILFERWRKGYSLPELHARKQRKLGLMTHETKRIA